MRKQIVLALVLVVSCGCTTASVRDHAVNQAVSVADMRYREVLDNLAIVAHNTGTLPSFGVTTSGIANVTNTISVDPTTVFSNAVRGFSQETLNASGSHNPELLWTIAPVVAEPNLEALKYACLWILCGPPPEGSPGMELLRAPNRDDVYGCQQTADSSAPVGFHFDVASQLETIHPGWLGVGSRGDVPREACYKAHCGNTYVWVTAGGLAALSEFTLVVLDIATVDPTSLVLQHPTATVEIQLPVCMDASTSHIGVDNDATEMWASFQPPTQPSACGSPPKPPTKPDTVAEVWDVCQEPNASGTIRISRPKAIRPIASQVPDILLSDFSVLPTPPTAATPAAPPGSASQAAPPTVPLRVARPAPPAVAPVPLVAPPAPAPAPPSEGSSGATAR